MATELDQTQRDQLTDIPRDDLPELRDQHLFNWPEHIIGYDLIQNYIRWYEQEPNYQDARIYSLNNDWQSGTFIIIVSHHLLLTPDNPLLSADILSLYLIG